MILATLCYVKQNRYTLMVHRNKNANYIHEGKRNGLRGKFFSAKFEYEGDEMRG